MTDNEIIKALRGNILNAKSIDCKVWSVELYKIEEALDIINRQKAEIEGLNIELQSMRSAANSYKTHYETAKSDAIKEFAHFVIDRSRNGVIYKSDIPDLVKEMTEV